ncbi:hypothetical protein J6590_062260 [Homalodisca vitripennis]|nr:hypothetical protein J6590_062260 [Homalodisca vitripennis]
MLGINMIFTFKTQSSSLNKTVLLVTSQVCHRNRIFWMVKSGVGATSCQDPRGRILGNNLTKISLEKWKASSILGSIAKADRKWYALMSRLSVSFKI